MPERVFDIRFQTRVERTPRVMEVAESFGIGLAAGEFVVYDNLRLRVDRGDVVYITGQSGSGKSLLLKRLAETLESEGEKVGRLDVMDLEDAPLIEQIGRTTTEGLTILAQAGISDAYLYLRTPDQLSDGQRYRARLAKLIETGAQVWVADEFGAVLDRPTAKAVAHNVSRAARKIGATLIVATTHEDLVEELAPTVTVRKLYRERVRLDDARGCDDA